MNDLDIKKIREMLGISQEQLAEMGIAHDTLRAANLCCHCITTWHSK